MIVIVMSLLCTIERSGNSVKLKYHLMHTKSDSNTCDTYYGCNEGHLDTTIILSNSRDKLPLTG